MACLSARLGISPWGVDEMATKNGVGFAWPFLAPISSTGEMRVW
jgi:hypothetical protein